MSRKDQGQSRWIAGATFGKLALITLLVLVVASLAPGTPQNDQDEDGNYSPKEITWVYQHSYDEVFQACQEAIERLGWRVTVLDKDKGTISNSGIQRGVFVFTLHIESLNTKPETRVTFTSHYTKKMSRRAINPIDTLPGEVQKVLATYR
ncbi:MAG: hypothetical protein ACLPHP_02505 [Candidatus Sulfotelmatobacter sp.]